MTSLGILKDKKGFTLVELLITIGITLVLASAAVPIYGNLQVSAQLNENTTQIVQTLRTAHERSVARQNDDTWGVYLTATTYTLYKGATYATRDAGFDRTTTLDNALTIATTLTGNEVNFSKGLGVADNIGTVTLTHDVNGSSALIINAFGVVEEQ
jgi:prepilin-type N-terminal cleavage/methylation domain-containing protein